MAPQVDPSPSPPSAASAYRQSTEHMLPAGSVSRVCVCRPTVSVLPARFEFAKFFEFSKIHSPLDENPFDRVFSTQHKWVRDISCSATKMIHASSSAKMLIVYFLLVFCADRLANAEKGGPFDFNKTFCSRISNNILILLIIINRKHLYCDKCATKFITTIITNYVNKKEKNCDFKIFKFLSIDN